MYDSSRGIVIEKLGVGSCAENPPIWKSEKPHGCQVFHSASEAAIFIPCALVTASPKRLPTDSCSERRRHRDDQRELRRAPEQLDVAAAQEVPAGDAEHEDGAEDQAGRGSCAATRAARSSFESSAPTLVSSALPSTIL